MWSLHSIADGRIIYLLTGKVYTIGRKDADIVIANDSSVSRKHGKILVEENIDGTDSFSLTLTDTSKFGTFYRDIDQEDTFVRVIDRALLKNGYVIRIGVQHTSFKVKWKPMVVISSLMDKSSQASLKNVLLKLGSRFVHSWQQGITHLVMNEIILNVKVTQALASACHIVTDNFFNEMITDVNTSNKLPLEEQFVPPVSENGLDKCECSFHPEELRRSIFQHRMFIFLSKKQMSRLGPTCRFASANVTLITDIQPADLNTVVSQSGSAVLYCNNASDDELVTEKQYDHLQEIMIKNNVRFIKEHEIGLALLYCSVDVYTNPQFDLTNEMTFAQISIPGESLSQTVAQLDSCMSVTEESALHQHAVSHVPESVPDSLFNKNASQSTSKKRLRDVGGVEDSPSKSSKNDEFTINQNHNLNELLHDYEGNKSGFQPKSNLSSQLKTENTGMYDMPAVDIHVEQAMSSKSKSAKPTASDKNMVTSDADLPSSCIYDDGLWSCKTESDQPFNMIDKSDKGRSKSSQNVPFPIHVDIKVESTTYDIADDFPQKCDDVNQTPCSNKAANYDNMDGDLMFKNLAQVIRMSLVVKSKNNVQLNISRKSNVTNYKKFKKVLPFYKSIGSQSCISHSVDVPNIIGGSDLIKHGNRVESNETLYD